MSFRSHIRLFHPVIHGFSAAQMLNSGCMGLRILRPMYGKSSFMQIAVFLVLPFDRIFVRSSLVQLIETPPPAFQNDRKVRQL
jgi:hypothetical protein